MIRELEIKREFLVESNDKLNPVLVLILRLTVL